jgi:hypothetical protein
LTASEAQGEKSITDSKKDLLNKYRMALRGYDLSDDMLILEEDDPKCKVYGNHLEHKSNSKEEFDKVIAGSAKWEDPVFGAVDSSLWAPDRDTPYRFDKISDWKRPSEIDTERKPKIFGSFGEPKPQGIA